MNIKLNALIVAFVVMVTTLLASSPSKAQAADQLEIRTYESVQAFRKETTIDERRMFAPSKYVQASTYPIHGAFGAYTGHIRHHGDTAWAGSRDVLAIEEQVASDQGIDLKTADTLVSSVRHVLVLEVARRAGVEADIPTSELATNPAQATGAPASAACANGTCPVAAEPVSTTPPTDVGAILSGVVGLILLVVYLTMLFTAAGRKSRPAVSPNSALNSSEATTSAAAAFADAATEALRAEDASKVPPETPDTGTPSAAAPGASAPDQALNPDDTDAPFLNLPDRSAPKPKPRARKPKAPVGTGALPSLIEAAKEPRTPKGEGRGLDALMRDKPDPKPA